MVIDVDIGYVNARLRGMKSRLLDRKEIEKLIARPDIDSLIAGLEDTPYKEYIEKASISYSGVQCIEEALRKNLAETYLLMLQMVQGEKFEKYIKILLAKWDIQNIKTILRGKNIYAPSDEILECLIPAGELDEVTLIELIRQPDVKDVIDLLATWNIDYSKPLTQKFKEYDEKRDLWILEFALDKYYYENALNRVTGNSYDAKIVRDMITTEIDVINIKTILQLVRDRIVTDDTENIFIEGGKALNIGILAPLLRTKTTREAVSQLDKTPYSFLAEIPDEQLAAGKISVYERELDTYLIKKGIRALHGDPLSIAIAVGYLWAKYKETTNIRIISRCKTAGILEDDLTEELIYV
ncbi:MAG: ATP synthase A1 subunit C [Euryarchaeota archaeon]|nr:ATP synthase A1 subunit C [Euryarchaeota archaeon]